MALAHLFDEPEAADAADRSDVTTVSRFGKRGDAADAADGREWRARPSAASPDSSSDGCTMPISRSPASAASNMARYRGSKMLSGNCPPGRSRAPVRGKTGTVSGRSSRFRYLAFPTCMGPTPPRGSLARRPPAKTKDSPHRIMWGAYPRTQDQSLGIGPSLSKQARPHENRMEDRRRRAAIVAGSFAPQTSKNDRSSRRAPSSSNVRSLRMIVSRCSAALSRSP